jgi:hypothetical protein
MKTVWKFEIKPDDIIEISLPVGAKPLTVQEQNGGAQLWCLCNPNKTTYETRKFRLAGTGHIIYENILAFIGTFQLDNGSLVFHLFEVK